MVEITNNLTEIRIKIDEIDTKIINLIDERAKLVHRVGEIKCNTSEQIYIPKRENEIFERLSKESNIPYSVVKSIFTEIISGCRRLERLLNVGILNDKNSLLALKKILGEWVNFVEFNSLDNLFTETQNFDYLLLKDSVKLQNYLKNSDSNIVNRTKIQGELFYLIGKGVAHDKKNIKD
ncbi:MAG: chorismate mutase [Cetobacterium sp.]|uniref:chorismate mutase n=1 Tax=Cetobacterium sp. TaxID=2071632 RepID=UPI002FC5AC0B